RLADEDLPRREPAGARNGGLAAAPVEREYTQQAQVRERAGEQSDRRDREQRLRLCARRAIAPENRTQPDFYPLLARPGTGLPGVGAPDRDRAVGSSTVTGPTTLTASGCSSWLGTRCTSTSLRSGTKTASSPMCRRSCRAVVVESAT